MIKDDIWEWIKDQDIAGLIGVRIYPQMAPASATYPYIIFRRTAVDPKYHMASISNIEHENFDFSMYSQSSTQLETIVKAFVSALETLTRIDLTTVRVEKAFLENYSDDEEDIDEGIEMTDYSSTISYSFWYRDL